MDLMLSDEYPAYASTILEVYGEEIVPERSGRPGRPRAPYQEIPEGLTYATVHKEREGGRVVSVEQRVVYGTAAAVAAALESLDIGEKVNTAHEERFHGTDRNRNAEGTEDVHVLEGLGGACGGDAVCALQLQLLLASADASRAWRGRGLGAADARDVGGADGSRWSCANG